MYGTQNRAVTSSDYTSIIRRIYPSAADVITYGGEESDPPEYGKVKIAIKPKTRMSHLMHRAVRKKTLCVTAVVKRAIIQITAQRRKT